ncbi:putative 2,3-bisphosphoglycerate-independent phosphoglycerate mutase [Tanacetum coccineum]
MQLTPSELSNAIYPKLYASFVYRSFTAEGALKCTCVLVDSTLAAVSTVSCLSDLIAKTAQRKLDKGGSHNEKESAVRFLEAWKIPRVAPFAMSVEYLRKDQRGVKSSMVSSKMQPHKRVTFVLIDGLGDVSIPRFGYKTPLEADKVPNLDAIASARVNGIMDPVEVGLDCGSDTAHLSIMGNLW